MSGSVQNKLSTQGPGVHTMNPFADLSAGPAIWQPPCRHITISETVQQDLEQAQPEAAASEDSSPTARPVLLGSALRKDSFKLRNQKIVVKNTFIHDESEEDEDEEDGPCSPRPCRNATCPVVLPSMRQAGVEAGADADADADTHADTHADADAGANTPADAREHARAHARAVADAIENADTADDDTTTLDESSGGRADPDTSSFSRCSSSSSASTDDEVPRHYRRTRWADLQQEDGEGDCVTSVADAEAEPDSGEASPIAQTPWGLRGCRSFNTQDLREILLRQEQEQQQQAQVQATCNSTCNAAPQPHSQLQCQPQRQPQPQPQSQRPPVRISLFDMGVGVGLGSAGQPQTQAQAQAQDQPSLSLSQSLSQSQSQSQAHSGSGNGSGSSSAGGLGLAAPVLARAPVPGAAPMQSFAAAGALTVPCPCPCVGPQGGGVQVMWAPQWPWVGVPCPGQGVPFSGPCPGQSVACPTNTGAFHSQSEGAAEALPAQSTGPAQAPFEAQRAVGPARQQRSRPLRLWIHIYLHMQMDGFDLVPRMIGKRGSNTKRIAEATGAKIRIRGQGSGHLEIGGREAPTPLMVAVTTDRQDEGGFKAAVQQVVRELRRVEEKFWEFCQRENRRHEGPCFSIGTWSPEGRRCLQDICQGIPMAAVAERDGE